VKSDSNPEDTGEDGRDRRSNRLAKEKTARKLCVRRSNTTSSTICLSLQDGRI
jgi:hypothetical protein